MRLKVNQLCHRLTSINMSKKKIRVTETLVNVVGIFSSVWPIKWQAL